MTSYKPQHIIEKRQAIKEAKEFEEANKILAIAMLAILIEFIILKVGGLLLN